MNRVYSPSKHSYQGSTAPLDPTKCHYDVWHQGRGGGHHQCHRGIWKDKWCKQHHPDSIAARAKAKDERYRKRVIEPIENRHRREELVDYVLKEARRFICKEYKTCPQPLCRAVAQLEEHENAGQHQSTPG